MANRARKPNESFKAYRRNLRLEEMRIRDYLQGRNLSVESQNKSVFSTFMQSTQALQQRAGNLARGSTLNGTKRKRVERNALKHIGGRKR
jgi:hypothetical protein